VLHAVTCLIICHPAV